MSHGGMTPETALEYLKSLVENDYCTCQTKTNNPAYHAAHCKYRIWTVATYGTVVWGKGGAGLPKSLLAQ